MGAAKIRTLKSVIHDLNAGVAKLVDVPDLGSGAVRHESSSLSARTFFKAKVKRQKAKVPLPSFNFGVPESALLTFDFCLFHAPGTFAFLLLTFALTYADDRAH